MLILGKINLEKINFILEVEQQVCDRTLPQVKKLSIDKTKYAA